MSRYFLAQYILPSLYLLLLHNHLALCHPAVVALTVAGKVAGLAKGGWSLYGYIKKYTTDDAQLRDEADLKLRSMSVERHLAQFRAEFPQLRRQVAFDRRMEQLATAVRKIEVMFTDFVAYKRAFSRDKPESGFPNSTYEDYVHRVFRGDLYGLAEKLDEIGEIVAPAIRSSEIPVTDTLAANSEEFSYFCETKVTQMQLIGQLLGQLTIIEAKGLLVLLFGYDVKEWLYGGDFTKDRNWEQRRSLARFNRMVTKFKALLALMSNEIHACDPWEHVASKSYVELEGLLQTHLMREDDVVVIEGCRGTCAAIDSKVPACPYSVISPERKQSSCKKTYRCSNQLRDCKPLHRKSDVEPLKSVPQVCISAQPYATRRYDFVAFNESDTRACGGKEIVGALNNNIRFPWGRRSCIYCECTCMRGNNQKAEYKFSLLPSTAFYDQNYVMTGARFVKRDDVIYIQIQQGKLQTQGGIDPDTIQWRSLPDHDKNQQVTWNLRGVNLDNLNVPVDHVVVGVGLDVFNSSDGTSRRFGLQLMYLPFDYANGLLSEYTEPQVMIANLTERSELRLDNKDLPTRSFENARDSQDDQFLVFQPSGLEQDGGQSTVPFIDTQDVESNTTTPLSGVGLIHRGSWKSGGFLSLNLFTYNFTSHLHEDHVAEGDLIKSIV